MSKLGKNTTDDNTIQPRPACYLGCGIACLSGLVGCDCKSEEKQSERNYWLDTNTLAIRGMDFQ